MKQSVVGAMGWAMLNTMGWAVMEVGKGMVNLGGMAVRHMAEKKNNANTQLLHLLESNFKVSK